MISAQEKQSNQSSQNFVTKQKIDDLIAKLELENIAPGFYLKNIFKSDHKTLSDSFSENNHRAAASTILALQHGDETPEFHRSNADEVFYYHGGSSNLVFQVELPDGNYKEEIIGNYNGVYKFYCVVPANSWFRFHHQTAGTEHYTLFSSSAVPAIENPEKDIEFDHSKHVELQEKYPFAPHTKTAEKTAVDLSQVPDRFGMFNMVLQLNSQKELLINSDIETVGWLIYEIFNNHSELWSPLMRTNPMGLREHSLVNLLEQIELRVGDQRIDNTSDLERSLNSVFPEADVYNLTISAHQEAVISQSSDHLDEKARLVEVEHSFVSIMLDAAIQERDIAAANLSSNAASCHVSTSCPDDEQLKDFNSLRRSS